MRTYEDTFSGARIYPGKVRSFCHLPRWCDPVDYRNAKFQVAGGGWWRWWIAWTRHTWCWTWYGQRLTDIASQGKLYVRGDSKIFRFQNGKSESLFLQRKNPRRIAWTVLYRRQHRKGISEEVAKKRTRRTVKAQRGIVGASLDVIKEKRNIRPEARSAARAQAIKESKEKKQAEAATKKSEKAKLAAQASKGQAVRQVSKQGAKGSAPKVQAKTR
jgi:large subunit ribosomal protein L24e